jgi:hypothetical protein
MLAWCVESRTAMSRRERTRTQRLTGTPVLLWRAHLAPDPTAIRPSFLSHLLHRTCGRQCSPARAAAGEHCCSSRVHRQSVQRRCERAFSARMHLRTHRASIDISTAAPLVRADECLRRANDDLNKRICDDDCLTTRQQAPEEYQHGSVPSTVPHAPASHPTHVFLHLYDDDRALTNPVL